MNFGNQAGAYVQQQQEAQRYRDEQERQRQQSIENQNRMYQQWREQSERQQKEYARQQAENAAASRRMQEEWDRSRSALSSSQSYGQTTGSRPSSGPSTSFSAPEINLGPLGVLLWFVGIAAFVTFLLLGPLVLEIVPALFR